MIRTLISVTSIVAMLITPGVVFLFALLALVTVIVLGLIVMLIGMVIR